MNCIFCTRGDSHMKLNIGEGASEYFNETLLKRPLWPVAKALLNGIPAAVQERCPR